MLHIVIINFILYMAFKAASQSTLNKKYKKKKTQKYKAFKKHPGIQNS